MISTLIEMVTKYDSVRCSDEYCEETPRLGHERRCVATNAPFCEFHFVEVHRPDCGYCTLHLEQQRESILKGVPTLDLERWADDQQSGPIGAVVDGDRLLPQSSGREKDAGCQPDRSRRPLEVRGALGTDDYRLQERDETSTLLPDSPLLLSTPSPAPDDPEGKIGDLL